MRLKLFTALNFVVRYQSICFACFIKKCFGRVILKTGVKPRFLMSPVLKSVFFINRVRVLLRQVRLFSKVSPSVESGFFSSPGFVRVLFSRVRVRVRSGFRSMPLLRCLIFCRCCARFDLTNHRESVVYWVTGIWNTFPRLTL